jgi:hypothetical protein
VSGARRQILLAGRCVPRRKPPACCPRPAEHGNDAQAAASPVFDRLPPCASTSSMPQEKGVA